jgi:hypothetical protein
VQPENPTSAGNGAHSGRAWPKIRATRAASSPLRT